MTYHIIYNNLFSCDADAYLAHCISADYALGAGIAKTFEAKYHLRQQLHTQFPKIGDKNIGRLGSAARIGKVFNLITKTQYWQKPTYTTLRSALADMRRQCEELHVQKLAMPCIGCGLDKLEWPVVEHIIQETFTGTAIDIIVYTTTFRI